MRKYGLAVAGCLMLAVRAKGQGTAVANSPFVRAGMDTPKAAWGFRRGIQVGIWPADVEASGTGGPRGLLRIGYPILADGKQGLVNFIAVEPVVGGKRGYSELERSATDGRPGRAFWSSRSKAPPSEPNPGTVTQMHGFQRLEVPLSVERFDNGARPTLLLQFDSNRPDEVRLVVRAAPDSAPMDACILTATMGNYERLRRLWLGDDIVSPSQLWPEFEGDEFTEDRTFPSERLFCSCTGDLLVCATCDEEDPGLAPTDPRAPHWAYRGLFPVTQYWRKPAGDWSMRTRVRVNARRVYWADRVPIPHGPAFENFELVEPFAPGQVFIFGITRRKPEELGLPGPEA